MKVATKKASPSFNPVSMTITFETKQELDTFGALFNYVPVCSTARELGLEPSELRSAAVEIGARTDTFAISRAIGKHLAP